MTLGIYVDRWRYGTHSEKEVDELISFCERAGIDDIYLHCHEDRAVNNNWDYVGYALSRTNIRIHLWVSLTLGRQNTETLAKVNILKKPTDGGKFYTTTDGELGTILSINPKSVSARDYFIKRIKTLLSNYPGIYGFHVDKTTKLSDELMQEVRQETKGKYLSITYRYGDDFFRKWEVDECVPMFSGGYSHTQLDVDLSGVKSAAISLFACNLETTKRRIKKLQDLNIKPILYSYGAYSYNPKETYTDFLEAIQNV